MTTATLPLALVSDNAIVRSGLAQVLAAAPGVRVHRSADSITALPADDPPALLVLDLSGPRTARLEPSFCELRPVRDGGLYVGAELLGHLLSQIAPERRPRDRELTGRETETLRWLARGLTQAQIGERMGLADGTVSTYVKRLRVKLNAGSKPELIRRGIELGHLTP
jgi:DNA-binding NarL/FixJ family response regulator